MSIELYNQGGHRCLMFTDLCDGAGDAVQSNQFLIVDDGHGAVIDPGGNMAYSELYLAMTRHFPPSGLTALIAFLSATLDIVLDAYRRELLPEIELGIGNAIHVNAYKLAGLVPGSLSLILADHLPWPQVFLVTALFMAPGLAMTLMVKEPFSASGAPRTLRDAVVEPFREFFGRHGLRSALVVLGFIFLYKLGDSLCTALATPFYLEMGFSKTEIGLIAKNAGLWPSVIGGSAHYYFAHSYAVTPHDRAIVAATTSYGESFASAIASSIVTASPRPASPARRWRHRTRR